MTTRLLDLLIGGFYFIAVIFVWWTVLTFILWVVLGSLL